MERYQFSGWYSGEEKIFSDYFLKTEVKNDLTMSVDVRT